MPAHPEGQRPLPDAQPRPDHPTPRAWPLSPSRPLSARPSRRPQQAPATPRGHALKGSGPACGGSHTPSLPFPSGSGAGTPLRVQTQRLGARDAGVRRRRRDGGEWAPRGPQSACPSWKSRVPHPCQPVHSAQTSVPATCIGAYSVPTPGFLCCHIQSKQAQDVSTIAFYSSTFERTECQSKRGVCPRLTLRGELGF